MKWLLLAIGLYLVKMAAVYLAARIVFRCYVAGRTEAEALRAFAILLERGYDVTSDILGEFVKKRRKLPQILAEYERHIAALAELKRKFSGREVAVTVKPSRIGLEIGTSVFRDSLLLIAKCACAHGIFLWVDAEKLADRERTVPIVVAVRRATGARMGFAVQSVHSSSTTIVDTLIAEGLSLRIVKGAYKDGNLVNPADIRDCFVRIFNHARVFGGKDITIAGGTHDETLIDELLLSLDPRLEIQMLYGIRMKLQEKLREEGVRMHVYVPSGGYWDAFSFLYRRIREGVSGSALKLFLRNIRESREMQTKWRLR